MTTRENVDLPDWNKEVDVVVVGYGGAGATAAITAHDAGSSVLILEKLPADVQDSDGNIMEVRHHPNSRMSGGQHWCATSAEDMFTYQKAKIERFGINDVSDDMLWAWAQEMAHNHEWLWSIGADYEMYFKMSDYHAAFPELAGAESIYFIRARQGGWGWFGLLSRNVRERGIEVLHGTPAKELVQDPRTREILGVLAEDDRGRTLAIKANKAVVLTSAGFEYNMEMQYTYLPAGPIRFNSNTGNTGDGIRMAQKVGADLWHMNSFHCMTVGWWPDFPMAFSISPWSTQWSMHIDREGKPFPDYKNSYSVIKVDKYGKRFLSEVPIPGRGPGNRGYYSYLDLIHYDADKVEFPRMPSHMIFDEKTRKASPMNGPGGAAGYVKQYDWSPDNSKEIERGWIRKADTIRELAEQIGVPADNLEETVNRWNRFCREGDDQDFGRPPDSLEPIVEPPFYEIIQWPGGPNTNGGPKRNKDAQIVDLDGEPIPRLYSAGEMGSIYTFTTYEGGGNTGECMAFGRIAGRNAAQEKSWGE